ncbi:MAG: hypothetical protein M0R80_07995 [Proteobacteria bacterium]|jgi:hypothetical protein|nr:hypothetical protein [Pseudomonadota bacterium]
MMGGERETKTTASVSRAKDMLEIGSVRIHEKGGMVHFHADAQDLKVACPVAKWFSAWDIISQVPGEWTYVDDNTAVSVVTKIEGGILDAAISLYSIAVGDTFAKLNKFTEG